MTKLPRAIKIWTQVRRLFYYVLRHGGSSSLIVGLDFVTFRNRTVCAGRQSNDIDLFNLSRGSPEAKPSYQ